MGAYDRASVLEMGIDAEDVDKAERHFGLASVTTEGAVNWIFEGMPGYDPGRPLQNSNSHAVVPYNASGPPDLPAPPPGWETHERRPDHSGWEAANSLTSMRNEDGSSSRYTSYRHDSSNMHEDVARAAQHDKQTQEQQQHHPSSHDEDRGIAGRNVTPVGGMDGAGAGTGTRTGPGTAAGSSSGNPINLTSAHDSPMPPLEDADDPELAKALALSLADTHPQQSQSQSYRHGNTLSVDTDRSGMPPLVANGGTAGHSAAMSRQTSRTQQQEDDDMAKALNMSMADMQASATLSAAGGEEESIEKRIRPNLETPMALVTPSSLFLSYVPAVIHTFFYNLPFRNALLALDFGYDSKPASFDRFETEKPAVLTRALLSSTSTPPLDAAVKLAALQRLFAFMLGSRKAHVALTDVIHAFSIAPPKTTHRSPAYDMKELHDTICRAWADHHHHLGARQVASQAMTAEAAAGLVEGAKSLLYSEGLQLDPSEAALIEQDPDPEFFTNQVQAGGNMVPRIASINTGEVPVWPPEVNDTYASLDAYISPPNQSLGGFLYKTSASLYLHLNRQPRPFGHNTGPSPNDTAAQRKAFVIQDPLFLDRYSWDLRQQITKLRAAQNAANADLGRLQARIIKLGVYGQTGQMIVEPLSDAADKPAEVDLDRKKALLRKSIDYLERSSLTEEDEQRRLSQIYLVEKLTKLSNMLGEESKRLGEQIQQLQRENLERWNACPKKMGPYNLRSVVYWKGLPGRESIHTYVQAGTKQISVEGKEVEEERWFRITDALVEEVSKHDALNDPSGAYMPGGGSLVHGYTKREKETEAVQGGSRVGDFLAQALDEDNARVEEELRAAAAKQANAAEPGSTPNTATIDAIPMVEDSTVLEAPAKSIDADVQMVNDSPDTPTPAQVLSEPLRLAGGASPGLVPGTQGGARRRRSSISSDTGSVASTSKVRIGDDDGADGDDVSDEGEEAELVELGFAEKMPKKGFKVVRDVGKIGGKPTWLNPALPLDAARILCPSCNKQMTFLLQINAPLDDLPQAIYRTFYVYTCRKAACLSEKIANGKRIAGAGVKVFRVQLPADNPFYEVKGEEDQAVLQRFKDKQYSSLCASCKMVHEQPCSAAAPWQDWLIETGPEELDGSDSGNGPEDIEATMKSATLGSEESSPDDAKEPDTKAPVDAAFLHFQERLHNEPDQVLRYYYRDAARKAQPLWVSDEHKASEDAIPKCSCGSSRVCEFQILSTILSYIGVDDMDKESLDFGTIAVYTCEKSCASAPAPMFVPADESLARFAPDHGWEEEVAFVQNYSLRGVQFR